MARLKPQASEIINRNRRISFEFEGKTLQAFEGDTIGSALADCGIEIFSRSFKYHRPRGLLCVSGKCPNCLMNVNGVPDVRVCTRPLSEGDHVKPQHCWPSLKWDLLSLIESFDFLLPVGFYYKTLIKPRFLWKMAEPLIRRVAGVGAVPQNGNRHHAYEHEYLHTELTVVGGGPAGLSAARAAAEAGLNVVLIDDQPDLGGHLRQEQRMFLHPSQGQSRPGFEIARDLAASVHGNPRIKILSPAVAFGGYEGGLLGIVTGTRMIQIRAAETVVATGSFEYPVLFENNDLPGVMLGTGVRRLAHLYGVRPGNRAVVVTSEDDGLALAVDLQRAGVGVVAVVDQRPRALNSPAATELKKLKITHVLSSVPISASGRGRVQSLRVAALNSSGLPDLEAAGTYTCDLVCLCTPRAPSVEILRQNQGSVRYDPALNQMVPDRVPSGFHAVGHLTGIQDLTAICLQGRVAGLEAAGVIRPLDLKLREQLERLKAELKNAEERYRAARPRAALCASMQGKKQFACLCEDVTRKDIANAIQEGFDEMELLKRYTTASMGPCQGRMCLMPVAASCAAETGCTLIETGTTTSRPPVQPVPLGALAGPHHYPVKLTPMHHRHVAAGAQQMDMGEWKRPHTYTSREEEWQAVRERVGLVDVSTLGKLDVRGRDAGRLLDRVYTHAFSSLKVGRVRYGVICGDDGIILDDGTVSRVGEDEFYITTTTGNIDFVEKWLKWWLAGTKQCAHVTNMTGDFGAVNLAGPKAREVLKKLTALDVSSKSFKYMDCARAEVAGVPALLMRIGFVGETGWEIHFPAGYGEYLWDAVLEAGKEFGIAAFGVEAQRLLRLEKKHVIVGQDTDALSNPLESDMEWVIKFDKQDFIGKAGLQAARDRGLANKLVGFVTEKLVEEGSVIVVGGRPAGRVTSARLSPAKKCCVGLAWVPLELAAEGTGFQIQSDGALVTAHVHNKPFYDPEGIRLKE